MKDGMETLVQGLSGALKAPADAEITTRLDRVEKVQLEIKQCWVSHAGAVRRNHRVVRIKLLLNEFPNLHKLQNAIK
jgi:hypothetical protein